jgi:predicted lipoprotein with Yx(FWY)xxD motif
MAAVKHLLDRMETRTLVWLAAGRTASYLIVGSLVAAGLGAAALNPQPSTTARQKEPSISATLPMSVYGCVNDSDGDGHIFCDGSTPISQLPASYGKCHADPYVGLRIVCRGTGTGW